MLSLTCLLCKVGVICLSTWQWGTPFWMVQAAFRLWNPEIQKALQGLHPLCILKKKGNSQISGNSCFCILSPPKPLKPQKWKSNTSFFSLILPPTYSGNHFLLFDNGVQFYFNPWNVFFFWQICIKSIIWNVFSAFLVLQRIEAAAATNQSLSAKPGPEETSAGKAASLSTLLWGPHITSVL